ncbi:PREDICTED: uncharacterized protein LOC109150020 [Ipomoea nil]|uniref:uncharacterized protein LOC109150020 n=1 Tax=Ipomoea nil TaxID=35883 RepID=UPI000900C71F|nr:PREDICTED: uncharacterized protein LOC109150020 [Ipomoea nil]
MDVNNAFLHGDLNEEVYMVLPPGFQSEKPNQVCKLLRSLYGLKQFLDDTFKIKDLGPISYFLGIEAQRAEGGLNFCQCKFALDILDEAGFLECKPANTPMTQGSPTDKHMLAAHRVLRYIKHSTGQGLFFSKDSQLHLKVFSDSDWAACSESRKSITGYCVFLGDALVSLKSKKQNTVSRSSSEAEYRALAATTCDIQWLGYLLRDLQVEMNKPATLFCDNNSAIATAENHIFH